MRRLIIVLVSIMCLLASVSCGAILKRVPELRTCPEEMVLTAGGYL